MSGVGPGVGPGIGLGAGVGGSGAGRAGPRGPLTLKIMVEKINKNTDVGYIVLGDWNDDLRDKPGEHCFLPFLNDDRMYFVNTPLLNDESQISYPKPPYRSFLDHILVTEDLLQSNSNYRIMTIPIDDYMGGYDVYEKFISDHKPVMVGIPLK